MDERPPLPVLEVDGTWTTPLTAVPARRVRDARIKRGSYARGFFEMHNVGGAQYYHVNKRIPITELQEREVGGWKTWMVDDPLHWLGMGEKVEDLPPGVVLVAGLGLGLMLHHMKEQDRFTRITVVERSRSVIDLITPTLPDDPRVAIVCDDFYSYIRKLSDEKIVGPPDAILWDLAVGEQAETIWQFRVGYGNVKHYFPNVDLHMFGTVKRGPVRRMP